MVIIVWMAWGWLFCVSGHYYVNFDFIGWRFKFFHPLFLWSMWKNEFCLSCILMRSMICRLMDIDFGYRLVFSMYMDFCLYCMDTMGMWWIFSVMDNLDNWCYGYYFFYILHRGGCWLLFMIWVLILIFACIYLVIWQSAVCKKNLMLCVRVCIVVTPVIDFWFLVMMEVCCCYSKVLCPNPSRSFTSSGDYVHGFKVLTLFRWWLYSLLCRWDIICIYHIITNGDIRFFI